MRCCVRLTLLIQACCRIVCSHLINTLEAVEMLKPCPLPDSRFPDPPDVKPHRPWHISKKMDREEAGVSPKSSGCEISESRPSSSHVSLQPGRPTRWPFREYAVYSPLMLHPLVPILPVFEVGGHATGSAPTALGRRSCRGAIVFRSPHAACARLQHGWRKKKPQTMTPRRN